MTQGVLTHLKAIKRLGIGFCSHLDITQGGKDFLPELQEVFLWKHSRPQIKKVRNLGYSVKHLCRDLYKFMHEK